MNKIIMTLAMLLMALPTIASDTARYIVGDKNLEVPTNIIVDMSPLQWLKSLTGLDDEVEGFLFEFKSAEIKAHIPNYVILENQHKAKVIGSISDFSNESNERFWESKEYNSLWYALEDYDDREIIKHESSKYHLVFSSLGYRGKFHVFSVYPDIDRKMPKNKWDFLVAICSGSSINELKNVTCNRSLLLRDNLLVSYSFNFENLKNQPLLDEFIKQQITSWQSY